MFRWCCQFQGSNAHQRHSRISSLQYSKQSSATYRHCKYTCTMTCHRATSGLMGVAICTPVVLKACRWLCMTTHAETLLQGNSKNQKQTVHNHTQGHFRLSQTKLLASGKSIVCAAPLYVQKESHHTKRQNKHIIAQVRALLRQSDFIRCTLYYVCAIISKQLQK